MRVILSYVGNALLGIGVILVVWATFLNQANFGVGNPERPTTEGMLTIASIVLLVLGSLFKCLGGSGPKQT